MGEVIFAFACAESCNQFSDPSAEIGNGSFSGLAQKCFQFAEGLFDWIEIGRIFRQIKQPRTRSVDDLLHSDSFVGREVVYDDDVAALECRLQARWRLRATRAQPRQEKRGKRPPDPPRDTLG